MSLASLGILMETAILSPEIFIFSGVNMDWLVEMLVKEAAQGSITAIDSSSILFIHILCAFLDSPLLRIASFADLALQVNPVFEKYFIIFIVS